MILIEAELHGEVLRLTGRRVVGDVVQPEEARCLVSLPLSIIADDNGNILREDMRIKVACRAIGRAFAEAK